jgi:hypothetical protein
MKLVAGGQETCILYSTGTGTGTDTGTGTGTGTGLEFGKNKGRATVVWP